MPLFEFKCEACGTSFEKIVPTSSSKVVCKSCSSPRVEKLLSVFAVGGSPRSASSAAFEPGPCGACGAPERGSCGMD